jgi:hypothetical protein
LSVLILEVTVELFKKTQKTNNENDGTVGHTY